MHNNIRYSGRESQTVSLYSITRLTISINNLYKSEAAKLKDGLSVRSAHTLWYVSDEERRQYGAKRPSERMRARGGDASPCTGWIGCKTVQVIFARLLTSLPRASGGVSLFPAKADTLVLSSPCEWGCFTGHNVAGSFASRVGASSAMMAMICPDGTNDPFLPPSDRINIRHRLVYQVMEKEKTVNVIRMWIHYL